MTRSTLDRATLVERVREAVATVDDPEMPGVAITELGLVHRVDVDGSRAATVELMPTFSGCPALATILRDVHDAVAAVQDVSSVDVRFVDEPRWTIDRISSVAERALAELGIAVEREGCARCPRCHAVTTRRSLFGPTRCRAVHRCEGCGEVVEVMR